MKTCERGLSRNNAGDKVLEWKPESALWKGGGLTLTTDPPRSLFIWGSVSSNT